MITLVISSCTMPRLIKVGSCGFVFT